MGLFESSLALGLTGLVVMLAFQFSHHIGGGHGDIGHHGADLGHHGLDVAHHGLDVGHHGLDAAHHGGDLAHHGLAGGHDAAAAHPVHADTGAGHHVADHGVNHAHVDQAAHGHDAADALQFLRFIPSPVMIFSWLIGFGIAGLISQDYMEYLYAVVVAVLGGTAFQHFLIRPYWNMIFSFESKPAECLEGTLAMRAEAITSFDHLGCGLVRLDMDGETRDVLARLVPAERSLPVHKGDIVFVEMVNPSDNSVVVSRVDSLPDR